MAGIWLSVLLGGVLLVFTVVIIASSSASDMDDVREGSVLYFPLSGDVADNTGSVSLSEVLMDNGEKPLSLTTLTSTLRMAKKDDNIVGAFFELSGLSMGLPQCEELRAAMADFKSSGKWIWVYSDNYSQTEYLLAGAADRTVLNPIGMVDVHGLSATTVYLKDLMEKIGVEMQVVKVGTYKSAVEPFLLNDMSDANREQLNHFLGRMWDSLKYTIATERNVPADSVESWANSFSFQFSGEDYLALHMVDTLLYRTEVDEQILALNGVKPIEEDDEDDEDEVAGSHSTPRYVDYEKYYMMGEASHLLESIGSAEGKTIAVLYAIGDITEDAEDGIAATRLVKQINEIAENDDVDGLIMRVNSGGGSAFASEQIWKALSEYKATTGKPFYVSMGDMAASGGYYISCCADRIFASPLTLTGSIGIFGMIPNAQQLMKKKLGINTVTVATNSGNFPTLFEPMTQEQRSAMQSYVDRGYELFVKRCADGRHLTVDQIKAVAEGRVWDGTSALENGLVDALGGLDETIRAMAEQLNVNVDQLKVVEYPRHTPKWWEPLLSLNSQMSVLAEASSIDDPDGFLYRLMIKRLQSMSPLQARTDYIYIR